MHRDKSNGATLRHGQRVFKFAGCRLIDKFTAWDIAAVSELHTDTMTPGMDCQCSLQAGCAAHSCQLG